MGDEELCVTYLYHSGFAVQSASGMLVFDYYLDKCDGVRSLTRGVVTRKELARGEQNYVFVSHDHADHFNPVIFSWASTEPVEYILSADMEGAEEYPGLRMAPGGKHEFPDGTSVRAFGSTDKGVSFLVRYHGFSIFHAGDLNWWHWRDQSNAHEIDEAERDFKEKMAPLIGESIDIAFFPVDPRQGTLYDAGASYFAMTVKPRVLVPMHFCDKPSAVTDFTRRVRQKGLDIIPMLERGEQFVYRNNDLGGEQEEST